MRKVIGALALGGLVLLGVASGEKHGRPQLQGNDHVGLATRVFQPKETRNWRGDEGKSLRCTIWYPASDTAVESPQVAGPPGSAIFDAGSAAPGAAFAPSLDKFPVVLLSHGSGGSALQMAWLGTALARAGFIAIAVDHPGNNLDAPTTPEGLALWWERARDLSDVLDGVLADQAFGPKIDPSRIAAAGYSLGGYTVMELAGAQTDISLFFARCKANPDTTVCQIPHSRGMGSVDDVLRAARQTSGLSLARSGDSFRDPRVKAVFAIAPALGFTQTQESLRAMRLPVELVVGAEDRTAPAEDNASWLRENVRGARETILPGVSHYTFLDSCLASAGPAAASYCEELPGVDRAAVHAQVAAMAVDFFSRALRL